MIMRRDRVMRRLRSYRKVIVTRIATLTYGKIAGLRGFKVRCRVQSNSRIVAGFEYRIAPYFRLLWA
jgi:hypothetical protein